MYGLVNKAIHDLVATNYGEATWNEVKQEAGVEVEEFLGMKQYDDKVTYDLVGAASKVLGVDAYDILVNFGKFWILYTAKEGYGEMLESAGDNFVEFLENLNNMHMRVGYTYDNLQPPSFDCTIIDDNNLIVEYNTHRDGLAPLVVGLLEGLGDRFSLNVTIEHIKARADYGYDEFKVQHYPR